MGEQDDQSAGNGAEHPTPGGRPIPRDYRREKERVEDEHLLDGGDKEFTDVPLPEHKPRSEWGAFESHRLPESELQPCFFFRLYGEQAHGRQIAEGSRATLAFEFDVPTADILAAVEHAALASNRDIDIELTATARAGLSIEGETRSTARFHRGQLLQPVVFTIVAGPHRVAPSSIHIDFSVKGTSVHQTELSLRVVPAGRRVPLVREDRPVASVPLGLLPASIESPRPPRQRFVLSIWFDDADHLVVELVEQLDGEEEFRGLYASALDRLGLETLLKGVRRELDGAYADDMWSRFDGEPAAGADGPSIRAALGRTLRKVAAAGWRLCSELRTDPRLAAMLDRIETHGRPGATITVHTDEVFVPWELVYPVFWTANMSPDQLKAHPLVPQRFWGTRFAIETVQRSDASIGMLRRTQLAAPRRVSLNLNPGTQAQAPESQAITVQARWAERLEKQGHLDGEVNQTCGAMRAVLQDAKHDASLIYVYCHGTSAEVFGGSGESLRLHDGCDLQPIDVASGKPYPNAPIVFLNSCSSAAISPLTFSSFLSGFAKRGALGMIATSCSVPIAFGARFGAEVVDLYLSRPRSLATALLHARQEHLLERGNPVPLFYTLQCQLDLPA